MDADAARARLRELSDFAAPWAVWIAATLRLADHIEAGATRLDELAERAETDRDALHRLLRYLVARGVFVEVGGAYANSDVSRLLLDSAGWRPWLDLDGAPGIWAESWTRLLRSVRAGTPGNGEEWYYAELDRTGTLASFDSLMEVQVRANAQEVADIYDWESIQHVVDVGGGTGVMLRTLISAHPHLRATLFDRPQVVEKADHADRFAAVGGDFLEDPLPHADAYVLSQILHGWADDGAVRMLRLCRDAGAESARILVVESVLAERPSADEASFDLFMFTLGGGRQRTLDEFRSLGETTGLALRASWPLATGNSLIEFG